MDLNYRMTRYPKGFKMPKSKRQRKKQEKKYTVSFAVYRGVTITVCTEEVRDV